MLIGATLLCPAGSFADSFTLGEALEDTKLYFTAPVRWDSQDWLYFGGALLAVGASHGFDSRVRTHFATPNDSRLNGADRNAVRDALPAVALIAGTALYASFIDDSDGYREIWSLLEAGVFSTATTEIYTGWYTLSLHDALPISISGADRRHAILAGRQFRRLIYAGRDRKSTRLNSSHTIQSRMPSSA